ncbi:MAG TPA: sigma 54-interacting transcriptional regulator, partial [Nannocystaceae bacterium]|nr:sigma 54-interacting transcriptional regulator [Nannocystaceae bacterium]
MAEQGDDPQATVTRLRGEPASGTRRTLLVLGPGFQTSVPLGNSGQITVGRSGDNLVELDEPEVSRRHLILHLGASVTLEDLGSANGTKVGGVTIAPNSKHQLDAGVPVEIGNTMLVVQERGIAASPRRLASWDYFEARLDEECRRARRAGTRFAVLHVRCGDRSAIAAVERRLASLQPRLDVIARYVPGEYEVLLVGADRDEAIAAERSVAAGLGGDGVALQIGHAVFPDDGSDPDRLVAAAALRADGEHDADDGGPALVAESRAMRELLRTIERIAVDAVPVLVVGETGTGKELVAEEIHRRSGRADRALVRIDGATVQGDLAEQEPEWLAQRGGTIVIDEVCELPAAAQARLARILEAVERAAEQGQEPPRFVATTRHDVEAEIAAGRFRIDLFHRLDGVTLVVPPVRQRDGDLVPLVERFVGEASARIGRADPPVMSDAAMARLVGYRWPGNVRELRNAIRRAVLLADGPVILPQHLPLEKLTAQLTEVEPASDGDASLAGVREQFQALERAGARHRSRRRGRRDREASARGQGARLPIARHR